MGHGAGEEAWDDPLPPPVARPGARPCHPRREARGLWRPDPEAQPRPVDVALGEASLMIRGPDGFALAHWSLPALERMPAPEGAVRYAPGPGAAESVEIADPAMVEALGRILGVPEAARPRRPPGRLALALLLAAGIGAALAAGPGLLRGHALRVVPPEVRAGVGEAVLARLAARTGGACEGEEGLAALDRLARRLAPALGEDARIVALRDGPAGAATLPGTIVALSAEGLRADGPEVAAGHLLAAAEDDPLERLLREAGLRGTLRLLTAATVPEGAIEAHASRLAAAPARAAPTAEHQPGLIARFEAAGVSSAPYGRAVGAPALVAQDPHPEAAPALPAADRAALRNICEG